LIWFLIIFCEGYKLWSSSFYTFLHPPLTLPLLDPNIILSTLLSNTVNLCSSLNVRDQVSHPCKTTGKIIVLCSLIVTFSDRLEDRRFWTAWQQAFPEFSPLWIPSLIQFWCYRLSQIFELCNIFKRFVSYLFFFILSCSLVTRNEHVQSNPLKC
jgi:hypothetical protein